MKKAILILLLVLASTAVVSASDGDVKSFQLQNTFIGFGTGSRHQGDTRSADILLGLDIAGTSMIVSGGIGLAGSLIVYSMVRAFMGEVTKADIYISAGVLGAGIVTLAVSKALGISYPLKY